MRKPILFAIAWLMSILTLSASPLTPEQALQRLSKAETRTADELRCVYTLEMADGEAGLYVFQKSAGTGYMILSADDVAAPLLGYSDKGIFEEKSMSPELKWWLGEYAREIEYAKSAGEEPFQGVSTRSDKTSIAPLISTEWDQAYPYNLLTPEVDGKHCVTGCVATAMAQVMKYWNYPETGTGTGKCSIQYKNNATRIDSIYFDEQNFDWKNMLDIYDDLATENQKLAVAYLMKACGYAVNMNYSPNESGAPVLYVANSLVNNFFYNQNLQYCRRSYYSTSEWTDMLYGELSAGRPVVYGGQSNEGGHCFVCDGYDSDGYFHFNWGWGGMSDGYFLLNALNPGALGIGANGGGYNFGQEMVRGIQPTEGEDYGPNFIQEGNMQATMEEKDSIIVLTAGEYGGWYNMGTKPITIDVGTKIEPVAPTTGEPIYTEYEDLKDQTLDPLWGWNELGFTLPESLDDGKYRLTLCYRLSGTEEWIPVFCEYDYFNSVDFTKNGNSIKIGKNEKAVLVIKDAELLTTLYYDEAVKISLTVTNPTGKEITNYFYPALYSGGFPQMKADGVVITLAPGETVTKEFECVFVKVPGKPEPTSDKKYMLLFYDPTSPDNSDTYLKCYSGFSKSVTMKIDNTGVEGVASEEDIVVEYDRKSYRLLLSGKPDSLVISGMNGITLDRSAEAASGCIDLSSLPAGIYVVNAIGLDGNVKTLKIIK